MSSFTSLGITVSPQCGDAFIAFLQTLHYERPNIVDKARSGAVSAIWEERENFVSSPEYHSIMAFLDGQGYRNVFYESITDDMAPEIDGGYFCEFARVVTYKTYGTKLDIYPARSANRKILRRYAS